MKDQPRGGRPRWPTYRRPVTDEVEREDRDTTGRPLAEAAPVVVPARSPLGRRRLAACAVAAAIAGGGLVYATTAGEDAPEPYPREARHVPILTGKGLAAVSAELEARTGSRQVLDAWFEGDDEIRVSTPPREAGALADLWRWDGVELEKWSAADVGERRAFDLREVDPAILVSIDEEARGRSDGEISRSHAHVQQPVADHEHWIQLKVTEVDHGGVVLWAGLRGDVEGELVNESWRDD